MGLGVGWTVELKLNRKEKKKMDSNGWVAIPLSAQDPLLIMLGLHWDHAFHVLHDSKKRGRSWTSWNLLFIFSVTTS